MKIKRAFENLPQLVQLETRLQKLKLLGEYESSSVDDVAALIHALSDLEESFVRLIEEHFPRIADVSKSDNEIEDALLDVADEVRHIFYHLTDVKFFEPYLIGSPEYQELHKGCTEPRK